MDEDISQLSDESIAIEVQKGNVEAFGLLASRYRPKLIRYGNKLLFNKSEVEDAVQEIFLRSYQYIQSFDAKQKFSPWIYRIAHNQFINLGKKRTRELLDFFDPETFFPHFGIQPAFGEKNDSNIKELLDECVKKLDLKYKEPLLLYYIEGFAYKEIAQILKIPTGTVSIRIARGLAKLKNLCGPA